MSAPDLYYGKRKDLKLFIVQCQAYFHLHHTEYSQERQKVIYAISCLRGPAFDCFLSEMEDYVDEARQDKREATKALFESFKFL